MKKYPFSNKTMKAILAASIALTPLAPAGVFAQSSQTSTVQAASQSTAIERVTLIYSKLTNDQKVVFNLAAEKLKNFNSADWQAVLLDEVETKVGSKAETIAKELSLLVYEANATNLAAKVDAFKTSQAGQDFESITNPTGKSDKTINLIFDFLVDAEKELWKKSPSYVFSTPVDQVAAEIRAELIKQPKYADLNSRLNTNVGTNLEGIFTMKENINNRLVSKGLTSAQIGILRDAFIDAAFLAGNPNGGGTTPPPGGGGGGGTLPPAPGNPDPVVIELPKGAAEVVKEKNPSGMVEVVTKVVPEKVAEIVALLTAEKNTIEVVLETPAAGEDVKAEIPASLFTEAAKKNAKAVVAISTPEASYKLPVSEINVAALAAKLGTTAGNVKINISVNVVNKNVAGVNKVSDVIDFTIEAVAGNKKEYITTFSTYVERNIKGSKDFNKEKSVAVRLNANGTFSAIPTLFDGKTATIKSLTNSEYTIVENSKTFKDVKSGWAKEYIETLASKYIVYGKATGEYEPGKHMTRAEFAVLLVRALGLPTDKYDGSFKDVNGIEWFAKNGELTAAVKYGVIKGKGDGNFAPNEKITRAQAAAMIERAMKISFVKYDFSQLDKTKTLKNFKDANQIGSWAKSGVEAVYQAGIVNGKGDGTFNPNGYTQRNEMAAILANFLVSAKLLDDTFSK